MNQTRLEKYGAAVLFLMNSCMFLSFTNSGEQHRMTSFSKGPRPYLLLTFVDIESQGPHCYPHHTLRMVEKLDGLSVQGKISQMLNGNIANSTIHLRQY